MEGISNIKAIFKRLFAVAVILAVILSTVSCNVTSGPPYADSLADIPEFSGNTYVIINDNVPFFTEDEITTEAYEYYSPLDALGRCGVAMACLGMEIMPTEERSGSLSSVTPTGFINVAYEGEYLYHRAHLIGWQLAGENANKLNLITGTSFMNVEGMLPFENMVDDYIEETLNHVMYRVTPIFHDNELVARGVLMEAYTVEDEGVGRNVVSTLIKTFIKVGGSTLQINMMDKALLLEAKKKPQEHQSLIVRVCGYSERFVGLDSARQDEVIARAVR